MFRSVVQRVVHRHPALDLGHLGSRQLALVQHQSCRNYLYCRQLLVSCHSNHPQLLAADYCPVSSEFLG